MKALWCGCVVVAAGFAILTFVGDQSAGQPAGALPLGGFLKPGDKVALIEQKEAAGPVLRIVSADDLELLKKVLASDEVHEFVDEKTLSESLDKQEKTNPALSFLRAFPVQLLTAERLNALMTDAVRAIKLCTVTAVQPTYVVLKLDDLPAKEILIPVPHLRRIERGGILDDR